MKSDKRKEEQKRREEILRNLPTFLNQLLLLLSSGVILEDALVRIAIGYSNFERQRANAFTEEYVMAYEKSRRTGTSMTSCLQMMGSRSKVKEFSRVVRIISESRLSGADIWDKLARESEELWAERKRAAMERIKLSESKMSFPLGLLLTALILITAAPAMLQMYI